MFYSAYLFVAYGFGDDVARARESRRDVRNVLFRRDVFRGLFRAGGGLIFKYECGEALKAFFAGDSCAGSALWLEGLVDVFELGEGFCGRDCS